MALQAVLAESMLASMELHARGNRDTVKANSTFKCCVGAVFQHALDLPLQIRVREEWFRWRPCLGQDAGEPVVGQGDGSDRMRAEFRVRDCARRRGC
jgi:hypothetical protein